MPSSPVTDWVFANGVKSTDPADEISDCLYEYICLTRPNASDVEQMNWVESMTLKVIR